MNGMLAFNVTLPDVPPPLSPVPAVTPVTSPITLGLSATSVQDTPSLTDAITVGSISVKLPPSGHVLRVTAPSLIDSEPISSRPPKVIPLSLIIKVDSPAVLKLASSKLRLLPARSPTMPISARLSRGVMIWPSLSTSTHIFSVESPEVLFCTVTLPFSKMKRGFPDPATTSWFSSNKSCPSNLSS